MGKPFGRRTRVGANGAAIQPAAQPPQTSEPASASRAPAPSRDLSTRVPDYVLKDLRHLAADRDVPIRTLVLEALTSLGIRVEEIDMRSPQKRK